jgi:hypothetical protein
MLLGMVAAAIPLIIHLSHRRWARELPFAAIDFLLMQDRRVARRFRLRQILVLLLRTLLIAAVPFALAKPSSESVTRLPLLLGMPTSVVFVVDDSASMRYRTDDGTLLERAVDRTAGILDELPRSYNVALVAASRPARVLVGPLTFDRGAVRASLRGLRATEGGTDVHGALRLAEQLLAESKLGRRQVVLLSDLTVGGWPDLVPPWTTAYPPELHVVDVAEDVPLANVGIVRAVTRRVQAPGAARYALAATVRNDGPEEWNDLVTVRVGGRTFTGYLRVPPGEKATKTFHLEAGGLADRAGTVEIAHDALPLDDVRTFAVGRPRQVRALVLNGAPRSVAYRDEVFFLEHALRPERELDAGIVPVTMTVDEFSPAQLEHTDVAILANVGRLAPEHVAALTEFVRGGGGLLVTAGDNVTAEDATALGELLPLPVRGVREAGPAVVRTGFTQFAPPLEEHPLFPPFLRSPGSSLYAAQIRRYLLLDAAPRQGTEVLLAYRDGAPALVERALGEGRVLFLTTTIDRDWTDLPIRTSYLPLVQEIVRWLGRRGATRGPLVALVGESVSVPLPRRTTAVELTRPDGSVTAVPYDPAADNAAVVLDTLDQSGLYQLDIQVGGTDPHVEQRRIAVGPDPRELSVERVSAAEVRAALAHPAAGLAPGGAASSATAAVQRATEAARTRFWPPVLLGLFALLLFETWLVVRG